MAAPTANLSTLQNLLCWEADDPGDNVILNRIKTLIAAHLPPGWEEWSIRIFSKEELLGSELDPKILNKIRFAIPTIGIARAFTPDCTSLPEKAYRDIKLKLLEWPLCVGLIIHPMCLAARIRGSAIKNEMVIAAVADMKPLLKSREEANRELQADGLSEEEIISLPSSRTSSRNNRKKSRLDKLEEGQQEMRIMMEQFIKSFQPDPKENSFSDNEQSDASQDELYDDDDEENIPPQLPVSSLKPWVPPSCGVDEDFDWAPTTKQQEPTIPTPKPNILTQGIECQRLGNIAFSEIRYAEAQKRLHASPVFAPLKVNPILTAYGSSASQDHNIRDDYILGTITHGLLLQREALVTTFRDLAQKHPSIKQDLKDILSTDTAVKLYSDDLLQYVCGRRAEIIEQRRKALLPKDDYQASLLAAIPPSTTHLFDEKELAELLKQPSQQTFFQGTNTNRRPLRPKFDQASSSQNRSSRISKKAKFTSSRSSNQRAGGNKTQETFKRPSTTKYRDQGQPKTIRPKPTKGFSSTKKFRHA